MGRGTLRKHGRIFVPHYYLVWNNNRTFLRPIAYPTHLIYGPDMTHALLLKSWHNKVGHSVSNLVSPFTITLSITGNLALLGQSEYIQNALGIAHCHQPPPCPASLSMIVKCQSRLFYFLLLLAI